MDSINILFISFIILGISSIYLWLKHKLTYWQKRGISTSLAHSFQETKQIFLQQVSAGERAQNLYWCFRTKGLKHGGAYLLWSPSYVPIDISIVKSIMQVDFQYFINRGQYFNEEGDPLSAHLFNMEGKKWKLLRNKLTPTFTSGKMKMMFETVVNCTRGLNKVLEAELGAAVEIKDMLGRFTTDVIGNVAFGVNCNSLEEPYNDFRKNGKAFFEQDFWANIKSFMLLTAPNLMKRLNAKSLPTDLTNFFMNVVKDTVDYREKQNIFRKDFLHLLIQLKNRGKLVDDDKLYSETITEKENAITLECLAAQVLIFFQAGYETSSTTMTFCLYELAKNKEIQDKTREEIRRVLKNYGGKISYEAVTDLRYLEQVVNETLRKYPPLPTLARVCNKTYKVPGTDLILEKGVRVLIPVIGIHRDPEYYPEPDTFDPERFSEENRKLIPDFAFLPFGEGPRVCIGLRFGMMQTKIGLASLLLNYEFTVNKKTKEPIEFDASCFIISTKGGMWLDFEKVGTETTNLLTE